MLLRKTSFWITVFLFFLYAAGFIWWYGLKIEGNAQLEIGSLHLPFWVILYIGLQLQFCFALYYFNKHYWRD